MPSRKKAPSKSNSKSTPPKSSPSKSLRSKSSPSKPSPSKPAPKPSGNRRPVRRKATSKKLAAAAHDVEDEDEASSDIEHGFIVDEMDVDSSAEFEAGTICSDDESSSSGEETEDDNDDEEELDLEEPSDAVSPRRSRRHATPPPVTPVSGRERGRKRTAREAVHSDSDEHFVRSPDTDSPKKSKLTPKGQSSLSAPRGKNSSRQMIFDDAVAKAKVTNRPSTRSSPSKKGKAKDNRNDAEDNTADEDVEITVEPLKYLEDLDNRVSIPLLDKCGVFNPAMEDDLLKGTYDKLANLPAGKTIVSWKKLFSENEDDLPKVRFHKFSTIEAFYPDARISDIRKLLLFAGDRQSGFANLSRINPSELTYKAPNSRYQSSFICYRGGTQPAKLLMMGLVFSDKTKEPYQLPRGKWIKSFTMCPFALEFERSIASSCVIANVESFVGQIIDNQLTFTTRPGTLDSMAPLASPTKGGRTPVLAGPSSSVKHSPGGQFKKNVSTRGPTDYIPVLDARGKAIALPEGLRTVEDDFPPFEGPVPSESVALVCYTMGGYDRDGEFNLSNNILWAVVLEGPDFEW